MEFTAESHYVEFAAAYVRGSLAGNGNPLLHKPLDALTEAECEEICTVGVDAGLKLYQFKRTSSLPRVQTIIGVLRGLRFSITNVLDIGSGKGTLLWPLVDAFPELSITSVDIDAKKVEAINATARGGLRSVKALQMDVHALTFAASQFDVTLASEVIEHLERPQQAINEIVRVSKQLVVVTVPKHEDDNPEHIHLFDQGSLSEMLDAAGAQRTRVQYTLKEIVAVATL